MSFKPLIGEVGGSMDRGLRDEGLFLSPISVRDI